MASYEYEALYLGNFTRLDTFNGGQNDGVVAQGAINATIGGQTFGTRGNPAFAGSTILSLNDNNSSAGVSFDHNNPNPRDTITYARDGQTYTTE
ncbi:MAG: hypothetical protein Q4G26_13000, partial [Paracoccus sp. (in: a-proteobacteria)]|nr:hypothetical protein [Paracoccus sp. (in: a-proteobacteria)]